MYVKLDNYILSSDTIEIPSSNECLNIANNPYTSRGIQRGFQVKDNFYTCNFFNWESGNEWQ